MNHVKEIYIYIYIRKSVDTNFDKTFHNCWCGKHGFQTRTVQTTGKEKGSIKKMYNSKGKKSREIFWKNKKYCVNTVII